MLDLCDHCGPVEIEYLWVAASRAGLQFVLGKKAAPLVTFWELFFWGGVGDGRVLYYILLSLVGNSGERGIRNQL